MNEAVIASNKRRTRDPWERIVTKFEAKDGASCWNWTGALNENGYGKIGMPGISPVYAHRLMYELCVGPIPKGLEIDHLCFNRRCVNPGHLEAVTRLQNVRRAVKTVCKRGHNRGTGRCMECQRAHEQARTIRRRKTNAGKFATLAEALDGR